MSVEESTEEYTIPFTKNRFCGPAALAYVMRSDPDTAAALLRKVSGKRAIMRLTQNFMLEAMVSLKLSVKVVMPKGAVGTRKFPTLSQWLEDMDPDKEYIVTITGHYIVIHRGMVFDSKFHLGKPIAKCPYLRCRVRMAWAVSR